IGASHFGKPVSTPELVRSRFGSRTRARSKPRLSDVRFKPTVLCPCCGRLFKISCSCARMMNVLSAVILMSLGLCAGAAADDSLKPLPKSHERSSRPETKVLRGGWYPWDPYQYREYRRGTPVLTGFDVEIERAIARALGVELILADMA